MALMTLLPTPLSRRHPVPGSVPWFSLEPLPTTPWNNLVQGEYTAFHSGILPHLVHSDSLDLSLQTVPPTLCGLHTSQGTTPPSFILYGLAVAECHSPLYQKEVIQLLNSLL